MKIYASDFLYKHVLWLVYIKVKGIEACGVVGWPETRAYIKKMGMVMSRGD